MNYPAYVQALNELYLKASGSGETAKFPPLMVPDGLSIAAAPRVLVVPPHPDDECLMAGYALRMKEEWNAEVAVLPFSYGSNLGRQAERKKELTNAVDRLGFQLLDPRKLVQGKPQYEKLTVSEVLDAITQFKPQVIFSPHADDGHPVHIETHHMVRECIGRYLKLHAQEKILWVQTEFWRDMKGPNTLIPYTTEQVITLGEALIEHIGEVSRNPYHLRLPAWMMDQVRKGSELVGGAGSAANPATFGQVYYQTLLDHTAHIY